MGFVVIISYLARYDLIPTSASLITYGLYLSGLGLGGRSDTCPKLSGSSLSSSADDVFFFASKSCELRRTVGTSLCYRRRALLLHSAASSELRGAPAAAVMLSSSSSQFSLSRCLRASSAAL
ncbi:hypothetical protein PIB30_043065 [Stylosanthes scabra]|uniref:Uncharacterized protein n=1 Tax=Stylosanthes scabra TaxID=79078 RepID=A0ABU6RG07_9FABA|nr:hypothetical protein [Stylosanthes scabra]